MNPGLFPFRDEFCPFVAGSPPPTHFDRDRLDAAWREGVLPLLWHRFASEIQSQLDPKALDELRGDLRRQAVDRVRLRHALAQLIALAQQADIPILCLKGPALGERLYEPAERAVGDLDLLVDPEHLPRLTDLLGEQSYEPLPDYPLLWVHRGVMLDLHPDPLGADRIRMWHHLTSMTTTSLFDHAHPAPLAGAEGLVLDDGALLAYLVFHAAKHSFDRLIWLVDIARLADHITTRQGWTQTVHLLEEWRLNVPAVWALSYARTHLGADIPDATAATLRRSLDGWGQRIETRLLRHERIPFLAERLFARMLPRWRRPFFWWETLFPRAEIRRQIVGGQGRFSDLLRQRWRLVRRSKP